MCIHKTIYLKCVYTHSVTQSLSHSLSHSLTHSLSHSLTHSLISEDLLLIRNSYPFQCQKNILIKVDL